MKLKIFSPVICSIVIGYLIGYFIFTGYQKEVEAYNLNTKYVYTFQYGTYKNEEEMNTATKDLFNFLYILEDGYYKVYTCMTNNKEISLKLKDIFKKEDNNINIEEIPVKDTAFITSLIEHDKVLESSNDNNVLYKECSSILTEYKEVLENN